MLFSSDSSLTKRKVVTVIGCLAWMLIVGWLDHATGYEISFSLFYLFPIATAGWITGRTTGHALALLGAVAWAMVDHLSGHQYSSSTIVYWNATVRLFYFSLTVELLTRVRDLLQRERLTSQTDALTGLWNRAGLFELLEQELARAQRMKRPLTVAFIDLDNFKHINDTKGHKEGDVVLRTVATLLRRAVRRSDVVARLGGDEFVVLLPEVDEHNARKACQHVHDALLRETGRLGWSIGASIGVVTCNPSHHSANDLISRADDLMYRAKRGGKNRVEVTSLDPTTGALPSRLKNSGSGS